MARTVKVYTVVYDTGMPGGPAGDGTAVFRTRNRAVAEGWAKGCTCWGYPAGVNECDVRRDIAHRWGVM